MTNDQDQNRRIEYEKKGEPDGCYYCGNPNHYTSDCTEPVEDSRLLASDAEEE